MKKISFLMILFLALFSMGTGIKEQIEQIQPSEGEKRVLKTVVPDAEWQKPIYLYSRTGLPYRCFIRPNDFPLSCRRTELGQETEDALKQFKNKKI